MSVAVDFTASNGDPEDEKSLHYLGEKEDGTFEMNSYEIAIEKIGNILDFYAHKHKYWAYGFGATLPGESDVSHCFPLNKNDKDASITGLGEVLRLYRKTLKEVQLNGPTRFHQVLETFNKEVKSRLQKTVYHILLMLTDGCIHDMRETIDIIVEMSHSPISIIIIGIGDANFDKMVVLDADGGEENKLVDSFLAVQGHDIVQFV